MRIHFIKVCTDPEVHDLDGLQLLLLDESKNGMALGSIGKMEGKCKTARITSNLDSIRQIQSRVTNEVKGIEFMSKNSDEKRGYGSKMGISSTLKFTEDQPLLGLYGTESQNGIKKLGFITLDLQCQNKKEHVSYILIWLIVIGIGFLILLCSLIGIKYSLRNRLPLQNEPPVREEIPPIDIEL